MTADASASVGARSLYQPSLRRRRVLGAVFLGVCIAGTLFGIVMLALLLFEVAREGTRFLSLDFLQR